MVSKFLSWMGAFVCQQSDKFCKDRLGGRKQCIFEVNVDGASVAKPCNLCLLGPSVSAENVLRQAHGEDKPNCHPGSAGTLAAVKLRTQALRSATVRNPKRHQQGSGASSGRSNYPLRDRRPVTGPIPAPTDAGHPLPQSRMLLGGAQAGGLPTSPHSNKNCGWVENL